MGYLLETVSGFFFLEDLRIHWREEDGLCRYWSLEEVKRDAF